MNELNVYGDKKIDTTGLHGYDISSGRIDDLDRMALEFALSLDKSAQALDLGCGLGSQGLRFANLGLKTLLIDILEIDKTVNCVTTCQPWLKAKALVKDARELTNKDFDSRLSIVYSQRFIHYLRWEDALKVLGVISNHVQEGARFYISASGIKSELGDAYPGIGVPVERRFYNLSRSNIYKHGIKEKVCLYSEGDMQSLGKAIGLKVLKIWLSEFGNIKAVFEA